MRKCFAWFSGRTAAEKRSRHLTLSLPPECHTADWSAQGLLRARSSVVLFWSQLKCQPQPRSSRFLFLETAAANSAMMLRFYDLRGPLCPKSTPILGGATKMALRSVRGNMGIRRFTKTPRATNTKLTMAVTLFLDKLEKTALVKAPVVHTRGCDIIACIYWYCTANDRYDSRRIRIRD